MKYRFLVFALFTLAIVGCRKKAFDEYYGRPDNLEPPIYQTLAAKGNFTSLLAAIDKAGYKNTLGAAGYWTFFAPHDSAFAVYFTQQGISGIKDLDSAACRKIVTYCLVYNAFKKERIGDMQLNTGWLPANAFKRRTAFYNGVYNGTNTTGSAIKIIASNRNNNGTTSYIDADNNNKHIPYFVDNFLAAKNLTAADYNYFYPNTPYSGFNVMDAKVVEQDIPAENGVIHVINKVLTVLPGIDEYLASNPQYSEFKKLFDKYLVQYVFNQAATTKYQNINGGSDQIFTKVFPQFLAFSPNNENFLKQQDNDAQGNSYSMFVPTNAALTAYINGTLLEHYNNLDEMPINVIYDFVNAHMWQSAVWPSKFNSTFNVLNEEARFNPATDVVDKKILSNGLFYGTNKVQEANVFSSIYGKAYLDPKYSIMAGLLNIELKFQVSNIYQKYSMFLVSNDAINEAGFFADPSVSNIVNEQWRYIPKNGGANIVGPSALVRLLRILNLHVIPEVDLKSVIEPGVAKSYGGEFVGFKDNKVFASGNVDSNNVATVLQTKTAKNGTVHYLDRLLEFSEATIGKHITKLGADAASPFNSFYRYLDNSPIYNKTSGEILSVAAGSFYTIFIPNNEAILAAVNAGLLPGTGTAPNMVPNFNPSSLADRDQVANFIYYHILDKRSIGTDGLESGAMPSLYKDENGEPVTVFVNNDVRNLMYLNDVTTRRANVLFTNSNYLSTRTMIHLIDNYLKYAE